jgi:hypothetical protein
MTEKSPFVVGAEVARIHYFSVGNAKTFRRAAIAKVCKSGNFTLVGDAHARQWTPCETPEYFATEAGQHSYSDILKPWGPEVAAEMAEAEAFQRRHGRLSVIQERIGRLHHEPKIVTDALLTALEAALGDLMNEAKREKRE